MVYLAGSSVATVIAALGASALIVFRHRSNLKRWRKGQEPRIDERGASIQD
jgi:glycerol-3-phosphate acyltransferase PlsY